MKKRIIILGGVVLVVVLAWTAGWFVAANYLRGVVLAQAEADGITSPRIECGLLDVGGFPFRLDLTCRDAEMTSGDLVLTVPSIFASARVYAPTHVLASAEGPMIVADSFTGSRNGLGWSSLQASLRLDNWRVQRLSIMGEDMVWTDRLIGETEIARSPLIELHIADMPEQHDAERHLSALALYGRGQDLDWPGMTLAGADMEIELELTGLPDDVRNWGDPDLLLAMQAAGAQLRLVSLRGSDDQSNLDAQGNLGLDASGLVEGQIDITSTGVAERIGPLLAEPWRTLVLGTPGADGAYANQLNFRQGNVFSGLVPIAALPPLF